MDRVHVLCIVGAVGAVAAGAGVPVAVAGVVVGVLALITAGAAFAILPDMDGARATTAERLTATATSVRNSPWPLKPSMDGGSWV